MNSLLAQAASVWCVQGRTPARRKPTKMKDYSQLLKDAHRTVNYLTVVNYDSNGMQESELAAAKKELAAIEAERVAYINSPAFLY